jgi:uncharacterized protein
VDFFFAPDPNKLFITYTGLVKNALMNILHKELKSTGIFYIEELGNKIAVMSYRRDSDDHITISHTEVDDSLKGKGAGKQLLNKAVVWARENHVRITPVCSFALALFERVPEFGDVWDK